MTKQRIFQTVFIGTFLTSVCVFVGNSQPPKNQTAAAKNTVAAKFTPDRQKSLTAFSTILTVIKSPRCINCHPTADVPRQGDAQRLHPFGVQRGAANIGGIVQKCSTCHHAENNNFANVPGAPKWAVAPKTMGWFGLPDAEIARRLMDKKSNGGRSPKDLVEHMAHDSLVLWAWNPGQGRAKPPVELDEWRRILTEWLDNGAAIQ